MKEIVRLYRSVDTPGMDHERISRCLVVTEELVYDRANNILYHGGRTGQWSSNIEQDAITLVPHERSVPD